MKSNTFRKIAQKASQFDAVGAYKEADMLDAALRKLASKDDYLRAVEKVENGDVECPNCHLPMSMSQDGTEAVCLCGNHVPMYDLEADLISDATDGIYDQNVDPTPKLMDY